MACEPEQWCSPYFVYEQGGVKGPVEAQKIRRIVESRGQPTAENIVSAIYEVMGPNHPIPVKSVLFGGTGKTDSDAYVRRIRDLEQQGMEPRQAVDVVRGEYQDWREQTFPYMTPVLPNEPLVTKGGVEVATGSDAIAATEKVWNQVDSFLEKYVWGGGVGDSEEGIAGVPNWALLAGVGFGLYLLSRGGR